MIFCIEQVLEDNDYGRAVDWWGVGVVMYEMVSIIVSTIVIFEPPSIYFIRISGMRKIAVLQPRSRCPVHVDRDRGSTFPTKSVAGGSWTSHRPPRQKPIATSRRWT